MSEADRYREAAICAHATSGDRELAICKALQALSGESDEAFGAGASLAVPFSSASANAPNNCYGSTLGHFRLRERRNEACLAD